MSRAVAVNFALVCLLLAVACDQRPDPRGLATVAHPLKSITPTLSAETGMDKPLLGPASINQGYATAAYDGTNFLVVWKDYRRGGRFDVYAARVDPTGKVLDPHGIAVATTAGSKDRPHVIFDGAHYLVVWEDFRNGIDFDIYGARLTTAGKVLDPSGIAICKVHKGQHRPVAAHRSGITLVVWEDFRNQKDFDIVGARLDAAGKLLDPKGIFIASSGEHTKHPTVAAGPNGFLVAWTNSYYKNNDIRGTLVDGAGKVSTLNGSPICGFAADKSYPWATHDGKQFLVVWQDRRSGIGIDIFGTRVSNTNVVLDAKGFAISTAPNEQEFAVVAPHGAGYLAVWQDRRVSKHNDIYGALFSGPGKITGAPTISGEANYQVKPFVAQGKKSSLVVWEDLRDAYSYSIYGARVSTTGAVLDKKGFPISTAGNQQEMPAVGSGGGSYLVVWQDRRSAASSPISQLDLFGARVSSAGVVLDPTGIQITMAMDDQKEPAVAYGGGQYLVVWQDRRNFTKLIDVYGARISAAGKVLDASGIPISSGAGERSAPAVAFDGKQFLVVWQDRRNSGTQYDIYGARVDGAGKVLDPSGFAISQAAAFQRFPTVAHDGKRYLVVWQDRRNGNYDIYGSRVDGAGKVLDAAGVVLAKANNHQEYPDVARGKAEGFLVVWQDRRGADRDIYGTRVSGAGVALDPAGIAVAKLSKEQRSPAVSQDGNYYLVTWQDEQSGDPEVHGNLIDQSGKVLSTGGFKVADKYARRPAVRAGSKYQFLAAYHRFDPATTFGSNRVRARLVSWNASGLGCKTDGQCRSGFCVDSVCCDTACGGGSLSDCLACSVLAGAAVNGTCGPVKKGNLCRVAAGPCDQAEKCDGKKTACPPNSFSPVGTACPGGFCAVGGVCKPPGSPDLGKPDAALPPDLPPPPDLATPDKTQPPDLAKPDQTKPPADLALPDTAAPVDLTPPDKSAPGDLALPDKVTPGDLAQPDKTAGHDTASTKPEAGEDLSADSTVADWRSQDQVLKPDSFVITGPKKRESEGCNCRAGGGGDLGAGVGLLLPVLIGLLLTRRRRTRP